MIRRHTESTRNVPRFPFTTHFRSHLVYMGGVQVNGDERPRTGNHVYGTFGQDFATSDGRHVMVTAFTPRHWRALVEATGTAERMTLVEQLFDADFEKEEDRYAAIGRSHV